MNNGAKIFLSSKNLQEQYPQKAQKYKLFTLKSKFFKSFYEKVNEKKLQNHCVDEIGINFEHEKMVENR